MDGTSEAAQPPLRRRTFRTEAKYRFGPQPSGLAAPRELLAQPCGVDAHTAELRDRIAAAGRSPLIGSLLLRR